MQPFDLAARGWSELRRAELMNGGDNSVTGGNDCLQSHSWP